MKEIPRGAKGLYTLHVGRHHGTSWRLQSAAMSLAMQRSSGWKAAE